MRATSPAEPFWSHLSFRDCSAGSVAHYLNARRGVASGPNKLENLTSRAWRQTGRFSTPWITKAASYLRIATHS
jgi:hypothetical protein